MRTAVEKKEATLENVRETVMRAEAAMHSLAVTRGFTPLQRVLNVNPRDPSAATSDDFNPSVHHGALEDPRLRSRVGETCVRQTWFFFEVDSNARLRRASLGRHR